MIHKNGESEDQQLVNSLDIDVVGKGDNDRVVTIQRSALKLMILVLQNDAAY